MTPSTEQLTRLAHMSSIAKYTTGDNREFHHVMIDNGWIPVIENGAITEWGCYHPATLWSNDDAREYYNEHGRMEPPTPF